MNLIPMNNRTLIPVALTAALTSLWLMTRHAYRRRATLARLLRGDEGIAYSAGLVLILPLYTSLICVAVELAVILNVQIGVDYAAFAAARSAAVWVPAETTFPNAGRYQMQKVRLAAVNAITPFASAKDMGLKHRRTAEDHFADGFRRLTNEKSSRTISLLRRKYRYASVATKVHCSIWAGQVNELTPDEIKVTVTYEMPLLTPVTGFLMGKVNERGQRVRVIRSTVSVAGQFPKTRNKRLGWDYDSYSRQYPFQIPSEYKEGSHVAR